VTLSPERWQHVARIYELALDQDAATRGAFLSDACGGDEAMCREVESLLRQDSEGLVLDRSVWSTAAPLFDVGADLLPGTALGPYRIEGPLGAGGMGEVFRATDTRLNRAVAIKVLPPGVALDQQMRARFAREAMAVAALTHPHICTLYDVGRHGEIDFLVMEYLEGDTLASRLATGRVSLDEALAYAIEVASALEHAHRHGIVHRDLKPANIMLTASGAKLLDFGLAKFRVAAHPGTREADAIGDGTTRGTGDPAVDRVADDDQVTRHGTILGTIRYMAPEQIEGHEADARSDLFSFGAVFFEMLTGRRAFEGDSAASVRAAILEHEPPPITSLQPLAPAATDVIARRCLAKNPDERWQTASELICGLKQAHEVIDQARRQTSRLDGIAIRSQARRWGAASLVAALIAIAVWVIVDRLWHSSTTAAFRQIRSVAVLPLENLSSGSEQEYFADGMTEQLIANLASIHGLRVISSTSVMHYKTLRKPVSAIARELQVDALIEGAVVRAGNQVRITAKLIRGATGEIIWAQSFERQLRDVLALQSDVARTITAKVDITLTPQEQARLAGARPVDPEVHRQVLLGRHHAGKGTEDGLRKAIQHFDVGIAKDPGNALAHAGLAEAYMGLSGFYVDPREAMPKAKRAAETAVRLDESLADAHAVLGYVHLVYDWDGPAAEKALLRALALNPTLGVARLNYASYLTTQARHDEAVREVRRAIDLDPLSIRIHAIGTVQLLFSRRYDEAIELAQKGLEFEPNSAFTLAFQGVAYAERGRFKEAVDNLERASRLDNSLTILALQAHVLAVAGRTEQAKTLIRHVQDAAKHQYFCPYEIATVYVSLGDHDTAYDLFRKGTDEHADCMAWLGVEPWIDPFRSDPRYGSLLRDIGLAPNAR
jgi:eukaryotic-like serine/threonine-protein kinase